MTSLVQSLFVYLRCPVKLVRLAEWHGRVMAF